jgi:hypothetical protein
VHGGHAATLLDSACSCAVLSRLSATQAYTTLDLIVSYQGRSHATPARCAPRIVYAPWESESVSPKPVSPMGKGVCRPPQPPPCWFSSERSNHRRSEP